MVRGWVKNFSATDDELAKMTAKRLFSTPLFANILKYFFSDLDFQHFMFTLDLCHLHFVSL